MEQKNAPPIPLACPDNGAFIGWKKGCDNTIIKLLIPEDAKRSSATTRKCRASKAIVLQIVDEYGEETDRSYSLYDEHFVYEVGKTVEPTEPFDEDRWNECASGIHVFINCQEAVDYNY